MIIPVPCGMIHSLESAINKKTCLYVKNFCKEPVGENSFFKKLQDLVHTIKTFRIYSKTYCVHTAAMEFS